jgi:hypothetical protein
METVRELIVEEKLAVIDHILYEWEDTGGEDFICWEITRVARKKGFIFRYAFYSIFDTELAVILIPEFLEFRPENQENGNNWFGFCGDFGGIRTKVLQKLRATILAKKLLEP